MHVVETIVRVRKTSPHHTEATIPKPICDLLGLNHGDFLKLIVEKVEQQQSEKEPAVPA